MDFSGRIALITGAGNGIGRGIAKAFADRGADIAVCALEKQLAEETADLVEASGRRCYQKSFDIQDAKELETFVAEVGDTLGPVSDAVHNAGIMPVSRLDSIDITTLDTCLSVNLRAGLLLSRNVISHMKTRGKGSITFMSSVHAHLGWAGHTVYDATKAGLQGLARSLAMELAPLSIRANTVSPGTIDSPMLHEFVRNSAEDRHTLLDFFNKDQPRGVVGSIEEVANVFVFLASDEAANITGADIKCDGGRAVKGGLL